MLPIALKPKLPCAPSCILMFTFEASALYFDSFMSLYPKQLQRLLSPSMY